MVIPDVMDDLILTQGRYTESFMLISLLEVSVLLCNYISDNYMSDLDVLIEYVSGGSFFVLLFEHNEDSHI